jgi:hypothetical protein
MPESKKIVVQFDGYTEYLDAEDVYNSYGRLGNIEYVTFKKCKELVEGKWLTANETITKEIFIDYMRILNLEGNHPDKSYPDYLDEEIREFEMQYSEEKNIEDDPNDRYDSQREGEDYTEYMERMNHG